MVAGERLIVMLMVLVTYWSHCLVVNLEQGNFIEMLTCK